MCDENCIRKGVLEMNKIKLLHKIITKYECTICGEVYSLSQLEKILGRNRITIWRYIKAGKIKPNHTIGRRNFFPYQVLVKR